MCKVTERYAEAEPEEPEWKDCGCHGRSIKDYDGVTPCWASLWRRCSVTDCTSFKTSPLL